jgi:hypothetical protein
MVTCLQEDLFEKMVLFVGTGKPKGGDHLRNH